MLKAPVARTPAGIVDVASEDPLGKAMIQAQDGNAEVYKDLLNAMRALLKVYTGRILRRMGKYENSLVEDLVQDVLIAIHEKRHTYDGTRPFLPWMFAIARYKVIDYGRREKRKPAQVALEEVEEALGSPIFEEAGSAADLAVALSKLNGKSRRILELVKVEGLSVAEAATQTKMSESAIKVAVHRAIKSLRSQFKEGR
jgi:RNA polymerase sigma-70 factor (ECF subfamily)